MKEFHSYVYLYITLIIDNTIIYEIKKYKIYKCKYEKTMLSLNSSSYATLLAQANSKLTLQKKPKNQNLLKLSKPDPLNPSIHDPKKKPLR